VHRQFVWVVSLALVSCGGEGRKKPPEEVAPVVVPSSGSASGGTVKESPPSENACPVTGCPICLPPRACTMANGCSGTQQFCDGELTECALTSTSKRDCSECGIAAKQTCNLNGTFGECISSGRQCSCGGLSGTRTCSGGSWSECMTSTACGTPACGNIGQYRCRVDGTQYCKMPDGTASPTACTTQCGTPGFAYCYGSDGLCRGSEVCNNCDDNLDGRIDEGLARGCANRCGDPGTQQCVAGGWAACSKSERPELCDGQDNNCDGQIDEGTACRQDLGCQ